MEGRVLVFVHGKDWTRLKDNMITIIVVSEATGIEQEYQLFKLTSSLYP